MLEKLKRVAFQFSPDFSVREALEILSTAYGIGGGSPGVMNAVNSGKTFGEAWRDGTNYYLTLHKGGEWWVRNRRGVLQPELEIIDVVSMIQQKSGVIYD